VLAQRDVVVHAFVEVVAVVGDRVGDDVSNVLRMRANSS
jgi:hypothetical protein